MNKKAEEANASEEIVTLVIRIILILLGIGLAVYLGMKFFG